MRYRLARTTMLVQSPYKPPFLRGYPRFLLHPSASNRLAPRHSLTVVSSDETVAHECIILRALDRRHSKFRNVIIARSVCLNMFVVATLNIEDNSRPGKMNTS